MSASVLVPHGQARVPVGVGHSPAPRSPLLLQRARAMGPYFVPNATHKSSCSPRMSSCIITRAVAEEQEVASAAPTPPAPQQKIRIKLKSYWVDLLQVAVDAILDVAKTTGATVSGPVPLPTRCDLPWGGGVDSSSSLYWAPVRMAAVKLDAIPSASTTIPMLLFTA